MADAHPIEVLIQQCLDGDAGAQAALCGEYAPMVKSAVLRHLSRLNANPADCAQADDFVQEVFERLLADNCQLLRKLDRPRSIQAWLVTLARRHVVDRLRHDATRARYETAFVAEDSAAVARSSGAQQESSERIESVHQALQGLTDADRIVLELYYVEGLRYTEIADVLGLNINTMSARLRRAKEKLRTLIEESYDAFGR